MTRSVVETILGAIVLLIAGGFLFFSYKSGHGGRADGYEIIAAFASTGGLAAGDEIDVSGVKVGTVSAIRLDPKTYLAQVHMSVDPAVKLPLDTVALISSQSLLGGRYMQLQPGSDEEFLKPGSRIQYTQAPSNIEELLGKFIFSMQKSDKAADPAPAPAAPAAALPAPAAEVHP